jgi:pentatricopeptide repeat protein
VKYKIPINVYNPSSLVNSYANSGDFNSAISVFNSSTKKDSITYNCVLDCLTRAKKYEEVLKYYQEMKKEGFMPDETTCSLMLKYCGQKIDLTLGRQIHQEILQNGIIFSIEVQTSLLSMYSNCGKLEEAISVFNEIKEKNVVSYTSMISSYAKHGKGKEGIELFEKMINETNLVPDNVTFISLLTGCSHSGLVREAKYYFQLMQDQFNIQPKIDHHICMVDILSCNGKLEEADNYINSCNLQNNDIASKTLLGGCRTHDGDLKRTEVIVSRLLELYPNDPSSYHIMAANIYSKAELFDKQQEILEEMYKKKKDF